MRKVLCLSFSAPNAHISLCLHISHKSQGPLWGMLQITGEENKNLKRIMAGKIFINFV